MSLEGQQIDRYRIVRLLGSGGMGDVYLAEDPRIEQQVAIKVIRAEVSPYPDAPASQDAARLFQREAKAIAKLDHPHILPLNAYGEQHLGNMTLIYLVMPYRPEGSLLDWLRQRGQSDLLSPRDIAHLVHQAASALQHAHEHQIIHQDVKASNFLIRRRPEKPTRPDLLLADFGVARFSSATASASQTVRGTPASMAPEQWDGHPVPATDQYALAVMTYELLTGRPPFVGNQQQVMYQHLMVSPTPPSTFNPRLSQDIDTVLLLALAKKPEQRFATITAFGKAFQEAVQSVQETPASTRLAPPPTLRRSSDLRAVLAISTSEAQSGTSRTLNLPGGRQVTVPLPAGVQDGQIVRLEGQGEPASAGGEAGALILTIKVEAMQPAVPSDAAPAEPTVFVGNRAGSETSTPTVRSRPTESRVDPPEVVTPPSPSVKGTEPQQEKPSQKVVQPLLPQLMEGAKPVSVAVGTLLYTYRGHSDGVWAVACSPDGTRIASAGLDHSVQVWNAADGSHVFTYCGHTETVTALAWNPDSTRLASASLDNTVQLWDATDGNHVFTYRGHAGDVLAVAWSPDGTRIASASKGKVVHVWNATDGSHVFTYRGHMKSKYGVNALDWSPDGTRIASGDRDKTVQVWNAADGINAFTYRGHAESVTAVAWSPDGTRITSSSNDKTVQVWDATGGDSAAASEGNAYIYRGHTGAVWAVAWSPDSTRVASASLDHSVQVWDALDGGHVYTYRGHAESVPAVAWNPDGTHIASAGSDGMVQVWATGLSEVVAPVLQSPQSPGKRTARKPAPPVLKDKTPRQAKVAGPSVGEEPARKAEEERIQHWLRQADEEQARQAEEKQLRKTREAQARKAEMEQARKAEEERLRKAREEQAHKAEEERLARVFASQQSVSQKSTPAAASVSASSVSPQTPQRRRVSSDAVLGWTGLVVFIAAVAWWVLYVFFPYQGNASVIWWGLGGIVSQGFGLLFLAVGISEHYTRSSLRRRGVSVPGRISNHRLSKGQNPDYYVTYSYTCNGKTYALEQEVSAKHYKEWDIGASVIVSYLPEKPETAKLLADSKELWIWWIFGFLFGLACFVVPIAIVLGNHYHA